MDKNLFGFLNLKFKLWMDGQIIYDFKFFKGHFNLYE